MPANTDPRFSKGQNANARSIWTSARTGNTRSDGVGTIGTDMNLAFTAGADGAKVDRIRFSVAALAAAVASTPSVIRVYISTVASGATTAANTTLIGEIAAASQTAAGSTSSTSYFELPCGFALAPNETILWSMHHAAAANSQWSAYVFGGDF